MAAIAVEAELGFEIQLRAAPGQPGTAWPGRKLIDEREPPPGEDIEPWELHSELVLVCPLVRERACESLPERDPNGFLTRPRESVVLTTNEAQHTPNLTTAIISYAFWRLFETARVALFALGGVVALALLAEVLH